MGTQTEKLVAGSGPHHGRHRRNSNRNILENLSPIDPDRASKDTNEEPTSPTSGPESAGTSPRRVVRQTIAMSSAAGQTTRGVIKRSNTTHTTAAQVASPQEGNENEKPAQMLPVSRPAAVTAGHDSPVVEAAGDESNRIKPGRSLGASNKEESPASSRQDSK